MITSPSLSHKRGWKKWICSMAQIKKEPKTKQRRSRVATEQRLIDVALELIRKNGILAGLNLREVAEGAGVNRGNIYHYFGSRQELLRAAINRRFEAVVDSIVASKRNVPFVARRLSSLRTKDTLNDSQLRALLVLDGDDSVDPMPQYEAAISHLRQDVIDGDIHPDHDLEALHAALTALSRGYRIFRIPLAKRMGIGARELDVRVTEILRSWLEAMARPPGANMN
jgi:AcrR family transcriptional regulator